MADLAAPLATLHHIIIRAKLQLMHESDDDLDKAIYSEIYSVSFI